jgi:hypothetical protein
MIAPLDLSALAHSLKTDPEFRLHSRYLTAVIRVLIDDVQSFQIVIREGEVVDIDPVVTPFDTYDIQLAGTGEQWSGLLAETAPPFYQDFFPAMAHHGFRLEGDMEMIMAYYAAIRRLGDIFRLVAGMAVAA